MCGWVGGWVSHFEMSLLLSLRAAARAPVAVGVRLLLRTGSRAPAPTRAQAQAQVQARTQCYSTSHHRPPAVPKIPAVLTRNCLRLRRRRLDAPTQRVWSCRTFARRFSEKAAAGGASSSSSAGAAGAGAAAGVGTGTGAATGTAAGTAWYRTNLVKHGLVVSGLVGLASYVAYNFTGFIMSFNSRYWVYLGFLGGATFATLIAAAGTYVADWCGNWPTFRS